MSATAIRAAMETALSGMSPALATAWPNAKFSPTPGSPYQRADLMLGEPQPIELSGKWHNEAGYLQVRLCYPLDAGAQDALTRAELIRSTFKHGSEFTASGVTVTISNTPQIKPAYTDEDCFVVPMWVPFHAIIRRS